MSRLQVVFVHLANLAVCGIGLVYALMRYLVKPPDEWAVVNHPWQPHIQHLHVLTAPVLIFALGLIWNAHVIGKLKNGSENRVVGIVLTTLFLPMAASGYLLQTAVAAGWRETWMWTHVVSSLLWILVFVAHQVVALKKKRRGAEATRAPVMMPIRRSVSPGEATASPDDSTDGVASEWSRAID
jgi:hypothetical protein